jgi:hypothetical protein
MKKITFAGLILVLLLAASIGTVGAVRNGEPDGDGHPQVGIMVAADFDTGSAWRCSGALISPTVFLTAGHCTYGADIAWVWFESEITAGMGWPFSGDITGTPYAHPDYNDNAFFLHDVGVVILDEPISGVDYASVPEEGILDLLATRRGVQDTSITAVGYGLQRVRVNPAGPDFTQSDLRRDVADLKFIGVHGTVGISEGTTVIVSNNANGGTCFGDSGGPLFLNDSLTIVAVNSFVMNGNCEGIGGGYRIDQADDLAFIEWALNQ